MNHVKKFEWQVNVIKYIQSEITDSQNEAVISPHEKPEFVVHNLDDYLDTKKLDTLYESGFDPTEAAEKISSLDLNME